MVAKSLAVGLLCAAFVLGSQAQLIQVNENRVPSSEQDTNQNALPFGESDYDYDGGIDIVGPVNPNQPGESVDETNPTQPPKVTTSDPWDAFYDPDNKNIFGQTFPKPEEDNSGNKLPQLEPQYPNPTPGAGNNGGLQEVTPGFEFPGVETTTAPSAHHHPPTSGFVTHPVTSEPTTEKLITPVPTTHKPITPTPTTQKPTTTTKKHGGLGGLGDLLGWGKHTTKKPHTGDKNKGNGGILGGLKDAIENNKDAVHKAAESVKEAGEKVFEAGKDVLEAGKKIKESFIPGLGFLGGKN